LETTLTEYHFAQLRKSFEDWLIEELPDATSGELYTAVLFDHSTQAAALFVKYVCNHAKLLPPQTPERLFELEPEDLAKIAGAFFAASLVEISLSEGSVSTETLEEFGETSSKLFGEDMSAWQQIASRTGNVSSFAPERNRVFLERADKLLSISPEWRQEHPEKAEDWESILVEIYTLLIETGEKTLTYNDPLVRHRARLGFSGLLEFTAELYGQRAVDIPDSTEREFTDTLVETSLAFVNDTFFLKYLHQEFYDDLGNVKVEDLLRLCGLVYVNALFFLSVGGQEREKISSFDYATWLFGLSEEDCQPYIEAAAAISADPTWPDRKPEFLAQPQHECDRLFAAHMHRDPVLLTLWRHLLYAVGKRINLFDAQEEDRNLCLQTSPSIRELVLGPLDPLPRDETSNAPDANRIFACLHFIEIRDAARRDIFFRSESLLKSRDYDLVREIVDTVAGFLIITIFEEALSPAFYQHLSSITQKDVSKIYGLAYLDSIVLFAHYDPRNLVTSRLLKHISQVFDIPPDVVTFHKDLAKRVRKGTLPEDVQTSFQPALRDLFAPTLPQHADYIRNNYGNLLSILGRILQDSKQFRRVLKQGDNLGCLGSFLGLLAIALVVLGFVLFLLWYGR